MSTITVSFENDDGEEIELTLPSKMEVCPECQGEGYTLAGGLKGAAFSQEEFYETFDDYESREQYFTRGGIYDEQCQNCHGNNVVPVVDEEHITEKDKPQYEEWCKYEEIRARYEANDRAERDMERRFGC